MQKELVWCGTPRSLPWRCLLFHVVGLCIQTLPALAIGAPVSLQARLDADAWFDAVRDWRPSTTWLVPATMRALTEYLRRPTADLSGLRFIKRGSQIVPRALIESFHPRGVPVAQVYSTTETGPVRLRLKSSEAMAHVGMAGRPALGVSVKLAADGGIWLKAPKLMRGFHRSREPAIDADGWFHTGDRAVQRADGLVEVVGRSKELIISGGENIHPVEIEQLVAERPEVAECAVVGVADERWGEVAVLVVVPREGQFHDRQALQAQLDTRLARFKHPRGCWSLLPCPRPRWARFSASNCCVC